MKIEDKKTLLLVEDEALIALAKQKELENYGYNVLTVNTGEKAVAISKENHEIDLILMDIDLGRGIDGPETAEIILEDHGIPVVFLSSHIEPEVVEKTEKITSYGYVVKSSSITVLDASIKMAFKLFYAKIKGKKKELALQESENKFRLLTEKSISGTYIIQDGIIIYANHHFAKMFGYEPEEIIGKIGPSNLIHPDSRQYMMTKMKERLEGLIDTGNTELKSIKKDTSIFYIEVYGVFLEFQGKPAVMGTVIDITERKQAENKLYKNQYYLTKAQEMGKIGTWELDIQTNKLTWTDETYKIFGVPTETEINYDLFLNCVHPDDRDYVREKSIVGYNTEPYDIEYRLIVNNKIKWVRAKAEIDFDKTGNPIKAIGFNQDITNQKKTEAELLESEKRFRDIAESMADWIWEVDIEGRYTFCSERVESILGYSPNEIIGKTAFDLMCPEEKEPVGAVFGECVLAKKPIRQLENWNLTKDGRRVCLLTSGTPILDEDGNCTGYRGVNSDITEHKQTEIALRESEEHFRLLAENARDMIYRMSLTDGKYEYVSPASIDIFGYSPDEFYNSPFLIKKIFHPDWIDYFEKQLKLSLEGIVAETYEYQIIHKSGETRWINQRNFLIYDKNGKSIAIEGVVTDVSESKKAEEEIKKQLLEKEIILKETHHRIKNNFATIESLLDLQSNSVTNPEVQSALQDAIGRVSSMRVLYEKLLLTDDYQETSIKQYLMNLIDEIMQIFPGNAEIKIESQIDDFQLDPKRMVPIGIIINELLTNTMKYAFTDKDSGSIEVTLKEDNGDVTLFIQDNGRGLPEDFDIDDPGGFGLMLVKMLSQQLGGSFNIENQNGTRSILRFCI